MEQAKHKLRRKAKKPSLRSDFHFRDWSMRFEKLLESHESFASRYLLDEWKSKFRDPSIATDAERRSAAIAKWLMTEERNRRTNNRLYISPTRFYFGDSDYFLEEAARLIRTVIGDEPPEDLIELGSFTDGSSTGVHRGVGAVARKFESGVHVTVNCHDIADKFIRSCPLWGETIPPLEVVRGNILFTVPKTSTIDRCAAKEPDLNMFVQKGIGSFFRSRLLANARVDLSDQTLNQRLAKKGSSDGSLATIDLSSASDSVTTQLVCRLLPTGWFNLLSCVRSEETYVSDVGRKGFWHENEMFSSMGNAFTFELETLIFWSLTKTLASHLRIRGRVSVYGDDIICPSKLVHPLTQLFGFCGLLVNKKKTHSSGDFRESCGKHYYKGKDVSPFYIKEEPKTLSQVIHLANRLRGWLERNSVIGFLDSDFYPLWSELRELIPLPLVGSVDSERIDALVAYGRRNLAVLRQATRPYRWFRRRKDGSIRCNRRLAKGCYLHWFSQASRDIISETSNLVFQDEMSLKRLSRDSFYAFGTKVYWFSEELTGL